MKLCQTSCLWLWLQRHVEIVFYWLFQGLKPVPEGSMALLDDRYLNTRGFPGGAHGKEAACQCRRLKRHRFNPWVRKIPWKRVQQPTPVLLLGEPHGQRSLAGYRPWGHKGTWWKWLSIHAPKYHHRNISHTSQNKDTQITGTEERAPK